MFSTDEDQQKSSSSSSAAASPLQEISSTGPLVSVNEMSSTAEAPKMVVRNMNTGEIKEVQWVDDAMQAHTNPLAMSWWAYPLFGFPFILLANDAFHFLPEDGPISFLTRM